MSACRGRQLATHTCWNAIRGQASEVTLRTLAKNNILLQTLGGLGRFRCRAAAGTLIPTPGATKRLKKRFAREDF